MAVGISHAQDWANRSALITVYLALAGPSGRWQGSDPPIALRLLAFAARPPWQAVPRRLASAA